MLVLRSENVGNFQRMQEMGKTVGAYSAGRSCSICIHVFSYDHHYRATSPARALCCVLTRTGAGAHVSTLFFAQ